MIIMMQSHNKISDGSNCNSIHFPLPPRLLQLYDMDQFSPFNSHSPPPFSGPSQPSVFSFLFYQVAWPSRLIWRYSHLVCPRELPRECYTISGRGHAWTHITDTCTQIRISTGRRWVNVLTLFKPSGHVCLLCCRQLSWHAIMTLNSSVYENYDDYNSCIVLFPACHRCCERRSESY